MGRNATGMLLAQSGSVATYGNGLGLEDHAVEHLDGEGGLTACSLGLRQAGVGWAGKRRFLRFSADPFPCQFQSRTPT